MALGAPSTGSINVDPNSYLGAAPDIFHQIQEEGHK
jgi:hypothetical protein